MRRNEILDAAQMLVYTRGYEQMTIQDVLTALNISKGAFYHYFDSKPALLEAIVERMMHDIERLILPIIDDPELTALEKLRRYFAAGVRWKTEQKAVMFEILRIWYNDDNAIVRQKIQTRMIAWFNPHIAKIVRQGNAEGVFSNPYPDMMGPVLVSIMQSMGDTFAQVLLNIPAGQTAESIDENTRRITSALAAFEHALEQVLGAPKGSLPLMDEKTIREWVEVPLRAEPGGVMAGQANGKPA